MPHSLSAKKRVRQNKKRRLYNKGIKSSIKTQIKKVERLTRAGKKELALTELKLAIKKLDKAAKVNIYHKNTVARRKSRLTKLVNALNKGN